MKWCGNSFGILFGLFFLLSGKLLEAVSGGSLSEPDEESPHSSDYNYEGDDGPAEQIKATVIKPMKNPYFEENSTSITVQKNAKAVLNCPVKNYMESTHHILWYKEEHPITNGLNSLNNAYRVDNDFSLIINETTDSMTGLYSCHVMPSNVRQNITLNLTNGQQLISQSFIVMLFILIAERVFSLQMIYKL